MTYPLIEPPLFGERNAQIVMRISKFRINFNGPSKKSDAFIEISLDAECQSEIEAEIIGIRPQGESFKILFNRLLGVVSLKEGQPQIHVCNIVVLDSLNRMAEQCDVILPISELYAGTY